MYETDIILDTNELKMPFSVLVGIFNIRKTFLLALCFITSESAITFDFMKDALDKLFFYNCPYSKVVYRNFVKKFIKSITTLEIKKQEIRLYK